MDDEVFDEEDLAEGFDAELLEGDDLLESEELLDEDDPVGEVVGEGAIADDDDEDVIVDDEEVDDEAAGPADSVVTDDEDDLTLDQDVELALDEVLAETMRLTTEADEDEEAPPEPEEKGDTGESVLPRQDDEFRCRSCRLLKKTSQLADPDRQLCRDCV